MDIAWGREVNVARLVLWIARLTATGVVVLLMAMVFGEDSGSPNGVQEWAYLAFFPFGFSLGYLIGWRFPLLGGCVSLVCMALSLVVIGRIFSWVAYATWAVLCIPGALYIIAGLKLGGRPKEAS